MTHRCCINGYKVIGHDHCVCVGLPGLVAKKNKKFIMTNRDGPSCSCVHLCFYHAISEGHAECMRYFVNNLDEFTVRDVHFCIEENRCDIVQLLHEKGAPLLGDDSGVVAALVGCLKCLKYIYENRNGNFGWERVLNVAIQKSQMECIRYLRRERVPYSHTAFSIAARFCSLDTLIYVHKDGAKITPNAADEAAWGGNLDCLLYCLDQYARLPQLKAWGFCLSPSGLGAFDLTQYGLSGAVGHGHLSIMKYAHERLNMSFDLNDKNFIPIRRRFTIVDETRRNEVMAYVYKSRKSTPQWDQDIMHFLSRCENQHSALYLHITYGCRIFRSPNSVFNFSMRSHVRSAADQDFVNCFESACQCLRYKKRMLLMTMLPRPKYLDPSIIIHYAGS